MEPEFKEHQKIHAYEVCGLVANVKDRSVADVSIRCLAIAAECLETREAQEEALHILSTISQETVWHVEPTKEELRCVWGWPASHPETVDPAQMDDPYFGLDPTLQLPKSLGLPPGITNPLFGAADFSLEDHPYHGHYTAPHHILDHYHYDPCLI